MWGGFSDFLTINRRREDDRPACCGGSSKFSVPASSSSGAGYGHNNAEAIPRGQSSSGSSYVGSEGKATPYTSEVSTITGDGSSERSSFSQCSFTEVIIWEDLWLGHRIQHYRGYAHCVDDIRLLSCLLEMIDLKDVDGDNVKLLLRSLKFLRLCDYSVEDICSILAHASAYFMDAYAMCGAHMDASEVGNVLVTLMFLAHCHVQDETCPLHVWHQHLLRKYCPLSTLNNAIMRLLEIRRYILRLETQDLKYRYEHLLDVVRKRGVAEPGGGGRARGAPSSPSCSNTISPSSTWGSDGYTTAGTSPATSHTTSVLAPATPASSYMGTQASKSIGTSPAVSTTFDVGYTAAVAPPSKATLADPPVPDEDSSSRVTDVSSSTSCAAEPAETTVFTVDVSSSPGGDDASKPAGGDLLSKVLDHFKYQRS